MQRIWKALSLELMAIVETRVTDRRMLKLIRAFLKAGVMEGGLVSPVDEGTAGLTQLSVNCEYRPLSRLCSRRCARPDGDSKTNPGNAVLGQSQHSDFTAEWPAMHLGFFVGRQQ
jgi:hypothetical protein